MKKNIYYSVFLLLCITACSKQEPAPQVNPYETEHIGRFYCGGPEIDYDRAWDIAMEAPALFSDNLTKAGDKQIAGWTPVTKGESVTKSGTVSLDTLMYVFNYEGEQGYVIIPTDDLDGEVIAYVEEGNFNIQDTSSNELQKFLVDLMIDYRTAAKMQEGVKGVVGPDGSGSKPKMFPDYGSAIGPKCSQVMREQPRDGYYGPTFEPPVYRCDNNMEYYKTKGCYLPGYYKRTNNITCPPLLTTCWGQEEPFYNMTPIKGNKHAPTGCVATAVVQIMAYHNYPTEYIMDGYLRYTHFQDMRKNKYRSDFLNSAQAQDIISRFFLHIGNLLGNDWGSDGTGASSKDAPGIFRKFGYSCSSKLENYDVSKIMRSVYDRKPVFMRAHGYEVNTNKYAAHAWVIDGYKSFNDITENVTCFFDEYAKYDGQIAKGQDYVSRYYFHCNFGWNGQGNGYYSSAIYDTRTPQQATDISRDDPLVFNKDFNIITNITKPQ